MDNEIIVKELYKRFFDEADFIYVDEYGREGYTLGLSLNQIEEIIDDFFGKKT